MLRTTAALIAAVFPVVCRVSGNGEEVSPRLVALPEFLWVAPHLDDDCRVVGNVPMKQSFVPRSWNDSRSATLLPREEALLSGYLEQCGSGGSSVSHENDWQIDQVAVGLLFVPQCMDFISILANSIGGIGPGMVELETNVFVILGEALHLNENNASTLCNCLAHISPSPESPPPDSATLNFIERAECFFLKDGVPGLLRDCTAYGYNRDALIKLVPTGLNECSRYGGERKQKHLYKLQVQQSGRYVINTLKSPLRVHSAVYKNSSELSENGDIKWSLVRSQIFIDNSRCESVAHTSVTEWLEPGDYLLVVSPIYPPAQMDSVTENTSPNGNYSVFVERALAFQNDSAWRVEEQKLVASGLSPSMLFQADHALWHDTGEIREFRTVGGGFYANPDRLDVFAAKALWHGMAYVERTRMLYSPPALGESVLLASPFTNISDNATLRVVNSEAEGEKYMWAGIALDPESGRLFAAPAQADEVLQIDPLSNKTDRFAIANLSSQSDCVDIPENYSKWSGIAHAPNVGLLFAAPRYSNAVLVINPRTNMTNFLEVYSCSNMSLRPKWNGIVFAESTGLLVTSPEISSRVLLINPLTNLTWTLPIRLSDTTCSYWCRARWTGVAYAPTTGKVYAAPTDSTSVLIINPLTNSTDVTALSGLSEQDDKWAGIAFNPSTGMLYCAPSDLDAMLVIDPVQNTTDDSTIGGFGTGYFKWNTLLYIREIDAMYASPRSSNSILAVKAYFDPCTTAFSCARQCTSNTCGWDEKYDICRSDYTTDTKALVQNYGNQDTSCPSFQITTECDDESAMWILNASTQIQFVAGLTVNIPGPPTECALNRSNMFLHPTANDFDAITYEMSVRRNDGRARDLSMYVCADPQFGRTTIGNLAVGDYTAELMAFDRGRQAVRIATIPMNVREFAFEVSPRCVPEQRRIQRDGQNAPYYIDELVKIAGFPGECDKNSAFDGAANSNAISFYLTVDPQFTGPGQQSPTFMGDKLVDSQTAQTFINPTRGDEWKTFHARLTAVDGFNREVVIAEWQIQPILRPDTRFPEFGPNHKLCAAGQAVDEIPYDRSFTCDCTGTDFTGENCDLLVETQSSESGSDSTALAASLASILGILLLAAIISRVQIHILKNRPVDLSVLRNDLLQDMGAAINVDVKADEFGLSLIFDTTLDYDADLTPMRDELVLLISALVPRISQHLENAWISTESSEGRHLVLVLQQPSLSTHFDLPERTFSTLARKAAKRELVAQGHVIESVALTLNLSTPREIDRSALIRIKSLGTGAFGEVSMYQVRETRRGVPPYIVAAKTAKADVSNGRDHILREATLMAMFNHPHIVSLVGVVTVPRDLPALILLEFCNGGTLLQTLREHRDNRLSAVQLLTFVSEVALGAQYISARMIVHRDIAARNVLIDATGQCKIGDFGMSVSLCNDQRGSYVSGYVRIHEEIALRWAAPEVLTDDKFSSASDVWSFGVLIWEIFSGGREPYDGLGLMEVSAFVKDGGRCILAEDECPRNIFDELVVPCWQLNPSDRPSFGELYDIAVASGAQENSLAVQERVAKRLHRRRESTFRSARAYFAPSVEYIGTNLLQDLDAAMRSQSNNTNEASNDGTIYDLLELIVLPRTRDITCMRDNQPGAVYVDIIDTAGDVGAAISILSYAWQYPVRLIGSATRDWCVAEKLNPRESYIWLDVVCWNQHGRLENPAEEWRSRVVAIGHQLSVLHPWNHPIYVERAWCIFELWFANELGNDCDVTIVFAPEDKSAFREALREEGYCIIDSALGNIRSQSAEASRAEDLAHIRKMVQSSVGGFDGVNATVKNSLVNWFQSQAGIKMVASKPVASEPAHRSSSSSGELRVQHARTTWTDGKIPGHSASNATPDTHTAPRSFGFDMGVDVEMSSFV